MADDANALAQPAPAAPEATGTAPAAPTAPVSGDNQPEATPQATPPEKTFTQADVDRIVAQRLARQARQLSQRSQPQAEPAQPATPAQPAARPRPADFNSTEEYIAAAAAHEARQIVEQTLHQRETHDREARRQAYEATLDATFREREARIELTHADYHDTVYSNPDLVVTADMAFAIKQAENGAEIAYHLGKNPQEALKIARMHPLAQAMELAKIGVKIAGQPAPATQTSAPAPIPSVRPNSTVPALDTTDPRSVQQLGGNATAWIEADRARQRRLAEGRNR